MPERDNEKMMRKYVSCMEEIKKRTNVVRAFAQKEINAKYLVTTVESAVLQVRKILELIALSSLVVNKEQYSKKRKDFYKDWHATKILATLEKVNPSFFPRPIKRRRSTSLSVEWELDGVESGYLTRDDFIILYNRCCGLLHAENPLLESGSSQDLRTFLFQEVPNWMNRIIALMDHHIMQPVNDDKMYAVIMQADSDGKAHMTEFERREARSGAPGCHSAPSQ